MTNTQEQQTEVEARAEKSAPPAVRPGRVALWVLGAAAVLSLGGVVYSLYRVTGMTDGLDETGVVILANSLFSPIIIAAFAGAVAGVVARSLLKGPQQALAMLGALVIGLVAAAIAYASFAVDASIALVLALVLLGSAIVGGLFALPKRGVTVVAGLSATLLLLLFMYARGIFESSSVSLFSDPLDQYGALGQALPFITGLACGICAFLYLRKKKAGVKLLGHLVAGAIPGGIWLAATVIAQIGVEVLLNTGLEGEVSPLDSAFLALSFQWQYNGSMTAMFAGAFCAVLAFGLLMPRAPKAKAARRS